MKKEKKNNKLLIIGLVIITCVLVLYGLKLRQKMEKQQEDIYASNEVVNDVDEEIILGDTQVGCATFSYTCESGTVINTNKCGTPMYGFSQSSCRGKLVWSGNYCYTITGDAKKTCATCNSGAYRSGKYCYKCPKGSKCNGTHKTLCTGNGEYQDSEGQSSCKTCDGVVNALRTTCTACNGTVDRTHSTCNTCSMSYDESSNKLSITGSSSSGARIMGASINGQGGTYTPPKPGKYGGRVYFSDGSTCSASYTVPGCKLTAVEVRYPMKSQGTTQFLAISHSAFCAGQTATISCNGCNAQSGYSISSNSSGKSSYISVFPSGNCRPATVTVTLNGSSITQSFISADRWDKDKADWYKEPLLSMNGADANSKSKYGYCYPQDPETGEYYCPTVYKRACGSTTPPSQNQYKCYKNSKGELKWTNDKNFGTLTNISKDSCKNCYKATSGELKWTDDSSWGTVTNIAQTSCKNCYANNTDLNKATRMEYKSSADKKTDDKFIKDRTEKTCVLPTKITYCDPVPNIQPLVAKTANECEEDITIDYKNSYECNGTSFYKIKCDNNKNKITVSFDNGNDSSKGNTIKTTNELLAGQGFEFDMTIKTVKVCTATFDADNWKKTYDGVLARYNKAVSDLSGTTGNEKKILESMKNEYQNQLNSLKKVVNTYNSYQKGELEKNVLDIDGNFETTYKANGESKTLKTTFAKNVVSAGKGVVTISKTHNLGVSGLTNPTDFTWSTESNPTVVKYIFPKVYLDRNTGEITNNSKEVDGGNKLYLDYDTDNGRYIMKISLSKGITVTNNKCDINVSDTNIIYRPIDVSNPFINDSWEKGINWINALYDFTRVIHSTTWSEKSLYYVTLSANQIAELKKSNQVNRNIFPYLGLCNRQEASMQDEITRTLCNNYLK